jgi:hypothetical protein
MRQKFEKQTINDGKKAVARIMINKNEKGKTDTTVPKE